MLARFGHVLKNSGKRGLAAMIAGTLCVAVAAVSQASAAAGGVVKVRLGGDRSETRIVIDLDRSATG